MRPDFPAAYTNFVDHNTGNHGLNVVRSEYDDILFRHAASEGVKTFDGYKVTALQFSEKDPSRPIAAEWETKSGEKGVISFDFLVDAAGRQGLLSTKYHKDRKMSQSLKNTAIWAYWKDAKLYGEGTERQGSSLVESFQDNKGWAWYIPINDGTTSIGFVMHEEFMKEKKAGKTLEELYMDQFNYLEMVPEHKADAVMLRVSKDGKGNAVHQASDYSYSAEDVGKLNYRLCGDSAAFIDPFFSSGIHLAFIGGLSAALSIISVIDGISTEEEAAAFHSAEVKSAFMRFFVVVITGYRQMRNGQMANILNDIDEDNYDRAFHMIRPVIQGTGDLGLDTKSGGDSKLSEKELDITLNFVSKLIAKSTDLGKNEKLGDLSAEARERLHDFNRDIAYVEGHDGVKQILNKAREDMRLRVVESRGLERLDIEVPTSAVMKPEAPSVEAAA